MQLTTLIVVLCATCTAITVAPEQHPKPQLQQGTKASKALALRGGVAAAKLETTSSITWIKRFHEFRKLFRATDGLIMVFLWSFPYVLAAIPWHMINEAFPPINEWVQKHFFETVYLKEDAELAYIRWEILFIMGSLANTLVLMLTVDQNVRIRRCAAVWGTTFTLAFVKFYLEHKRGWIEGNYALAQFVHFLVALSCWLGVTRSLDQPS